jgi:hypothetical protein
MLAASGRHLPMLSGRAQVSHGEVQARSQQTPWLQKPLAH